VIGNSNYNHAGRLTNPVNDAAAVAALLKSAGFTVVEPGSDVGIAQMRRSLSDFADAARDSDIAVVYYAGHGIEVDGVNYLIPVDATRWRATKPSRSIAYSRRSIRRGACASSFSTPAAPIHSSTR
jgi:uncharacterized caspase-like protein